MTQEEKAKAYDEVLERARKIHEYSSDLAEIKRMEYIFPELAEPEDERIRKYLIDCVTRTIPEADAFKEISKEQILAWLEKQEQNPTWSEDDEKMKDLIISVLEVNHSKGIFKACLRAIRTEEIVSWLKSIKQRYTWKPSKEQMKALDSAIDEFDGYQEFDSLVSLKKDLEKLKRE